MNSDREAWQEWYEKRTVKPKPNKYGATAVHVDGLRFDSMREAARYGELKLLEQAGEITALEVQPAFPLMVADLTTDGPPWVFHTIGVYHADFQYRTVVTGQVIVEDVKAKPTRTEAYQRTKKHVQAQYGIVITEIA